MNLEEAVLKYPHLTSPAMLMRAHVNWDWQMPPHLRICNQKLLDLTWCDGGARLMVNFPFQHAKSSLFSKAYPAFKLLWRPETRIVLVAHEEDYAINEFGLTVRDIIEKFGPDLGVELKKDLKAKGEWKIKGHEGGMVCKGPHGGVTGRPADEFIIDDLIRDPQEAMSAAKLDNDWRWYMTVVFGRLRRLTNLVVVGTRWSGKDIFGRIVEQASRTKEQWDHIKFKAIAEENDVLGRQPGEALWPEQVPLSHLQIAKKEFGPWFSAAWQQEPVAEGGNLFKPWGWPTYADLGDAYSLPDATNKILLKSDVCIIVTVDWATSERRTADPTAIGVFGLTPDGRLLVLEVVNERLKVEDAVPRLAQVCRVWDPALVGVEANGFQAALANECRRWASIPEVRRLHPGVAANAKMRRSLPAMLMGQNGRILLPSSSQTWQEEYCRQLAAFSGVNDDHDDMVDVTSYAAMMAQQMRVTNELRMGEPILLTPGREAF